ncbi:MAG: hypothetical protein EOO23_06170 [Comamonadaceae bacterium]|nr:MAG: hypothetical protein EOO23_06170 [Comamonadaceae bacterium]
MPDIKSLAIYVLLATTILLGIGSCAQQTVLKATRFALTTQNEAIKNQKDEAAARLKTLNATVVVQQKRLDEHYFTGEKNDKTNLAKINTLQADMRRLRAAANGLLDAAAAAGLSGGTEQGGAPAGPLTGSLDGAEAYRLVPATPDQEADDDAYDADKINTAYASCRADALKLRRLQK